MSIIMENKKSVFVKIIDPLFFYFQDEDHYPWDYK